MGNQKIIDKTKEKGVLLPQQTVSNLTPAQATAQGLGSLLIGNYKGAAAFLDLDKLVNQPLAPIEAATIMGILDGRQEDYDLQTLAIALAEAVGTAHIAQITVPAGEVWFVNGVEMVLPASGGANIITGNWYCSLWTDRVGSLGYGQPFHSAAVDLGAGGGTQDDEFGEIPILLDVANKPKQMRLPAGTVITVIFTNTTAVAAAAVNATLAIFGYVGKQLVS